MGAYVDSLVTAL